MFSYEHVIPPFDTTGGDAEFEPVVVSEDGSIYDVSIHDRNGVVALTTVFVKVIAGMSLLKPLNSWSSIAKLRRSGN
jgi:hypothetical protein